MSIVVLDVTILYHLNKTYIYYIYIYPSIKRYTHGNSKEMKGRHPAFSKLADLVHIVFFLFLLESPTGGEVTFCSSIMSAN